MGIDVTIPIDIQRFIILTDIAPTKNITTLPSSIGSKNILISNTIHVIGRTADRDSFFSISFGFIFSAKFSNTIQHQ